jgi:hypothetical protein
MCGKLKSDFRMAKEARKRIDEKFDWDIIPEKYVRIDNKLISRR